MGKGSEFHSWVRACLPEGSIGKTNGRKHLGRMRERILSDNLKSWGRKELMANRAAMKAGEVDFGPLFRLAGEIGREMDLGGLLLMILEKSRPWMQAEACSIFLPDAGTGELVEGSDPLVFTGLPPSLVVAMPAVSHRGVRFGKRTRVCLCSRKHTHCKIFLEAPT